MLPQRRHQDRQQDSNYLSAVSVIITTSQQLFGDSFWATVCRTVRPMSLDRCLSVLSVCPVLSVTLVHCGQTVGRIKMKLGTRIGLGPGHIVLDGDPAPPPPKGTAPNFWPVSIVAKRLHGSTCHLVWR